MTQDSFKRRHPHSNEDSACGFGCGQRCRFPLYQSDEALARLVLGREADLWPKILRQLECDGLPSPRRLFGRMRYVPAVLAYFDRREGLLNTDRPFAEDGPERLEP